MIRAILSVSAWTAVSRVTGLARDVMLAAVLGAGPLADAFLVAFRLPNHFRAIFAEGAFSAAFVPAYARLRTAAGEAAARAFQGRMLALMGLTQLAVLALAWLFTPQLVALLAPGFADEPGRYDVAVTLTRITFPYLGLMSLVVLWSGVLNADRRFAAAAAAPVLLNLCVVGFLALAWAFPTAAHAASWGVLVSGALQAGLLGLALRRAGLFAAPRRPRLEAPDRGFWRALGPALIGSGGVQVAMFADTVLASLLPVGAVAALYYADRVYQLPLGVVAVAGGTVLLPAMSRRLAAGDEAGARADQNRAAALTLALAAPCAVAFLMVPGEVVSGLFARGAFTDEAARASAAVLAAYGAGLPAVVLIRAAAAGFQARGDTRRPMIASLTGVAANVALKVALTPALGAAGLALATSLGALVNLVALLAMARAAGAARPDGTLRRAALAALAGCLALAAALLLAGPAIGAFAAGLSSWRQEAFLALLALAGGAAYAGAFALVHALAGRLARRRGTGP